MNEKLAFLCSSQEIICKLTSLKCGANEVILVKDIDLVMPYLLKIIFGWNIFLKRKITEIKRMQVLAYDVVLNLVTQWGSCLYKFVLQMNHTYRFCAKVVYHGKEVTLSFLTRGSALWKLRTSFIKKERKKADWEPNVEGKAWFTCRVEIPGYEWE